MSRLTRDTPGTFQSSVAQRDVEAEVAHCVGGVISPLLANVALHQLDAAWQAEGRRLGVLVRYADDSVALCATEAQAHTARELMAAVLGPLGLQLHPDKTRVVCLARGAQGFDFLGWHHRKVPSFRRRGRYYLQRWPSARAMTAIRSKIREATSRRYVGRSVDWVADDLSMILRGWGNYFRYGNSAAKFAAIDSYAQERMAIFTSAKHGRSGRNWDGRYTYAWYRRLGVHRLSGTVVWV